MFIDRRYSTTTSCDSRAQEICKDTICSLGTGAVQCRVRAKRLRETVRRRRKKSKSSSPVLAGLLKSVAESSAGEKYNVGVVRTITMRGCDRGDVKDGSSSASEFRGCWQVGGVGRISLVVSFACAALQRR